MERQITIRFFEIRKQNGSDPDLGIVLQEIAAIIPASNREVKLSDDYDVRLEEIEVEGEKYTGELVRCQDTNMPSELTETERRELEVERLGHSVVFHFDQSTNLLAVQYDARIVSPGKIVQYIQNFRTGLEYDILPIVNDDAWRKFNENPLRKLVVRISSPSDLSIVGSESAPIERAIQSMGDAYEAPSITVEISMGRRKGTLPDSLKSTIDKFLGRSQETAHVEALTVGSFVEDQTESINLLKDIKVDKEQIELHSRDPETNWKIKRDHIRQVVNKHFS